MQEDKKAGGTADENSKEKIADLKDQTVKKDEVKKGYNEKNPIQPEGAFKPGSKE